MKWWIVLAIATSAAAHDLDLTGQRSGSAVIVRAAYAGTEACAYAQVLVFAPGDSKTEHQNGRTDAAGLFAFVPNRPGAWRVVIDDELGHRKELTIDADRGAVVTTGSQPLWQKSLTGASLILGLTGFLYGWKARRAR